MHGNNSGFTLVEIIATLVILGVIGSMAGFGLAAGTRAYVFSKENVEMAQRAQFALNRIRLEMLHMDSIVSVAPNSIEYTNITRAPGVQYRIERNANQLFISVGGNNFLLLDNLGTYTSDPLFRYRDNQDDPWSAVDPFFELNHIEVLIILSRVDQEQDFEFRTSINPRNNGARNAPKPIRHDQ
ncbi:type II secretion system protein [Desulfonatronum sp. SC1]|uniref:type II secretion system protein n=1 Tax=Desulfonatronum sp. SC1 TaxID=2109626 RepID=UPI000D319346|nr:type II secretion system protein [Desulfonatronum sp. SC1]PTN37533.1 hypothetical protein C6366_06120 [Desulfonatronum sp. SC1]